MTVLTFRFGEASALPVSTLRVLATRYLPRGVPKGEWPRHFDVWFPLVAPSPELLRWYRSAKDSDWKQFAQRYRAELKRPEAKHAVALLAAVAARIPLAVGCYCADENLCHRSLLRRCIEESVPVA
jgi:uncharacterized protein YeaO (DUF488 family)